MLAIETISLGNYVENMVYILGENTEIKIILYDTTSQKIIFCEHVNGINFKTEKNSWENLLYLEREKKYFSCFTNEESSQKMNGSVAVKKGINKIACSVDGFSTSIKNVFVAIKILGFHTKISFLEILDFLETKEAPLEKELLMEMNNKIIFK